MIKVFKKPSVAGIGFGLVLLLALILRVFVPVEHRTLFVHETVIRAEVAATHHARKNGLSGRQSLGAREGMLFLFPFADRHPFWMIDMQFPIDIIWIRDRTVVDIAANVPPPIPGTAVADLPLYFPRLPADKVLEIPAGAAKQAGIKIGDILGGV
jgi:uncharacterized membrane protein (UPF0127 family)